MEGTLNYVHIEAKYYRIFFPILTFMFYSSSNE